jgi:hypothetical protein
MVTVVMHASDPSAQEGHKFKASLGYIPKLHLKKQKMKQNKKKRCCFEKGQRTTTKKQNKQTKLKLN